MMYPSDFDNSFRYARKRHLLGLLLVALFFAGCGPTGDFEPGDNDENNNDDEKPHDVSCWEGTVEDYTLPPSDDEDDRPWILVDLLHTDIQTPVNHCLHREQYSYQGTYGFYRLFEHFEDYGYPWAPTEMELSGPRLAEYDILFINLVHSRNPDFTDDEVEAIKEFVHNGGGLFVIGDHTNVYRHAERINPFLEPMGLEMMYHTAVGPRDPVYSLSGRGWIMMHDFSDHVVNDGIDMISFKTGGPIRSEDPDDDLVFTSEDSFADYWDEDSGAGFYGNWTQGDDHELEPSGPLSVAAATEYGDGRVVLVGDQNIFGDGWVNLGHNFEFAANIVEWLAQNEGAEIPLRDQPRRGHNIAFESGVNYYQTARKDSARQGYYTFFIETNRNREITARATPGVEFLNTDTFWVLSSDLDYNNPSLDDRFYSDDELDEIANYLEEGGQVVISFEPHAIPESTAELISALTDDFELEMSGDIWSVDSADNPTPEKVAGFHPVYSTMIDVEDFYMGTLGSGAFPPRTDEEEQQVRNDHDNSLNRDDLASAIYRELAADYAPQQFFEGGERDYVDAYLYDVRALWGEPFLEAQLPDGDMTTIAQRKVVGDGELIIFVQDGFWRNRTLGNEELLRPKSFFRTDIIEFHHRFLDYLRAD